MHENMTKIENFISKVETEVRVARVSGIFPPDPERERLVLEKINMIFPELGIDPIEEQKIILHARISLNSHNN